MLLSLFVCMFVVYYNTGKAVLGQCCTCRRGGVEVVIEDVKRERELITRNWRVTFVPIDLKKWFLSLEI